MNARPRLLLRRLRRFFVETRAAAAVEYGLILALVVLVVVMAIMGVADATTGMWNNVSNQVTQAR